VDRLVVATNENDVLDEFFRTGRYRVRASNAVFQTSSPSMDISKASNFERFVFDLVGRDPAMVSELWRNIDRGGEFDLSATPYFAKVRAFGFVSGRSTHADRIETIRRVHERYGVIVDTHTADGIKVGLEQREPGVPLICLETAQPTKFADTIREALGRDPPRPAAYVGIEGRPLRFETMDADVAAIKRYIAAHTG
jgi:threonine synthase